MQLPNTQQNLDWHISLKYRKNLKNLAYNYMIHGENGGTLGMVPLIINPIYILYSGHLLGVYIYIYIPF